MIDTLREQSKRIAASATRLDAALANVEGKQRQVPPLVAARSAIDLDDLGAKLDAVTLRLLDALASTAAKA